MILPAWLTAWFGTLVGRICVGSAIALLTTGAVLGIVKSHDNKVIALHEAKIDKATTNATHTLRAAGARSTNPRVQGILDPTTKE